MKQILLFGAGKSSSALIDYFLVRAEKQNWALTVADAAKEVIAEKIGDSKRANAVAFDITEAATRKALIEKADIVISLLPPALHILVARDCIEAKKNLLTASYVDDGMKGLQPEIEKAGLLFLCEMGLDPGIDHMSAKKVIDQIHADGGTITSFLSHCGGLVAPESDDNPWHYKISWNSRNVVLAGKAGALFKENGENTTLDYSQLFAQKRTVEVPGYGTLCWYPNRNSLSYVATYGLSSAHTFIRTTLRHPDFIDGWQNIVALKLTDETIDYQTRGKSLQQFYAEHMERNGFSQWLHDKLSEQFDATKSLLSELLTLTDLEDKAAEKGMEPLEEFMTVDDNGNLQNVDIDQLKTAAAATIATRLQDSNLTLKQLFYLGFNDEETILDKPTSTAADVLQFALEKKLMLKPEDKDLVVMLHEIEFEMGGDKFKTTSSLVLTGDDGKHTAMAKTVGLPLAIAAKLILEGNLTATGLQIPITKAIYEPLLLELDQAGIRFIEDTIKV